MAIIQPFKSSDGGENISPWQSFVNYLHNFFNSFPKGAAPIPPANLSTMAKEALVAQQEWAKVQQESEKKQMIDEILEEKIKYEIDVIHEEISAVEEDLKDQDLKKLYDGIKQQEKNSSYQPFNYNYGGIPYYLVSGKEAKIKQFFEKYSYMLDEPVHNYFSGNQPNYKTKDAFMEIFDRLDAVRDQKGFELASKEEQLARM